ncbi:MAG TPA: hypothetical protein VF494_00735 [Candidatus Limnocylindrales bacterium]
MTQPLPPAPPPDDLGGMELASDLRNASDLLMQRIDRLYELEQRKRELMPDNPEFVRLAREVEDVARAALGATGMQVELATEVADRAKRGDATVDQPIRDVPPGPRDATIILSEWRAAERLLASAAPDSEAERSARVEVERLRREYSDTIRLRGDPGGLAQL